MPSWCAARRSEPLSWIPCSRAILPGPIEQAGLTSRRKRTVIIAHSTSLPAAAEDRQVCTRIAALLHRDKVSLHTIAAALAAAETALYPRQYSESRPAGVPTYVFQRT